MLPEFVADVFFPMVVSIPGLGHIEVVEYEVRFISPNLVEIYDRFEADENGNLLLSNDNDSLRLLLPPGGNVTVFSPSLYSPFQTPILVRENRILLNGFSIRCTAPRKFEVVQVMDVTLQPILYAEGETRPFHIEVGNLLDRRSVLGLEIEDGLIVGVKNRIRNIEIRDNVLYINGRKKDRVVLIGPATGWTREAYVFYNGGWCKIDCAVKKNHRIYLKTTNGALIPTAVSRRLLNWPVRR